MPDREWCKPEIRHALRERAAGALLSPAQKHAGVSQARLATATGIGIGNAQELVIPAGHWVMEQAPGAMLAALTAFLAPYRTAHKASSLATAH